jgi:co-chaperonin GroES (HSP10)
MAKEPQQQEMDTSLLPEISNINNFQPVGQRVIIRPTTDYAIKSKGGVYYPERTAELRRKTTLSKGEVVSIGHQVENTKVGQMIYFYWHEGDGMIREINPSGKTTDDDTIYVILPEYSVRGYIKDNDLEKVLATKASGLIIGTA